MIRKEVKSIGEALSEYFEENTFLKTQMAEHRAVRAWRDLLGEGVDFYTKNVYFKQGVLYVHLSSSVLRAELLMNKENLIKKLNDYAEMQIVRNIIFR